MGESSEGGRDLARLARHGRRALPFIEAGLHTAEPPGRRNLVAALRRIGDAEAAPLLLHITAYDAVPTVRTDARAVLEEWATASDPRGDRARAALRRLTELGSAP